MGTRLVQTRKMSLVAEESSSLSQWHDARQKKETSRGRTNRASQDDIIYRKRLESLTNTLRNMGDQDAKIKSRVSESLAERSRDGYRRAEIPRRTSRLAPLKIQRLVSKSEDPELNATDSDIALNLANNQSREESMGSSMWSRDETRGSSVTGVPSVSSSTQNSTSRQGTSSMLHTSSRHHKLAKYKKKKKGFMRSFAKLGKCVCVLIGLWRKHASKVKNFLDNVDLVSVDTINDLMFDKSDYSSDKRARISSDTKRILSMMPSLRTEKDIRYVEIALRNYSELAAYPVSIQNLIAKKAWYELYIGRRIIIKQGHVARCFYFILSGKVVITQIGEDSTTSHTLTYLNRGDSFGELGVLNHSTRTATVISEGTVEFLVVTDDDYEDIFSSGEVTEKYFPFFKGLSCLHDWPVDLLTNNKAKAHIAYSKRNTVLCENTEESPWIYIVQSGSVTVLKNLKSSKDKPRENVSKKRKLQQLNEEDHYLHLQNTIQRETRRLSRREMAARYHRLRDLQLGAHVTTGGTATPTCVGGQRMDAIDEVLSINVPHKVQPMAAPADLASRRKKMTGWQMGAMVTRTGVTPLPPVGEDGTATAVETDMFNQSELPVINTSRRVSFDLQQQADVDQKEVCQEVFVTVQTLVKGDVFGLAELIHGKQPSFSLVSNGAECIMIDKRTYWDKATDSQKLMRKLKDEVLAYPTDEKMQSDLVVTINWGKYKQKTLHKALIHARKRKRLNRLRAMGMSAHVP